MPKEFVKFKLVTELKASVEIDSHGVISSTDISEYLLGKSFAFAKAEGSMVSERGMPPPLTKLVVSEKKIKNKNKMCKG